MVLSIVCDKATVRPAYPESKKVTVDCEEIDRSLVEEIINLLDASFVLDTVGKEAAMSHFNLVEKEE